MDTTQKTLLELIKKSQFGIINSFPPDVDWDAVYKESSFQSVFGIVWEELPSDIVVAGKWQQAHYKQMASYIRYCYAEDELVQLMNDASIPFVVLKGNAAAIYYKDPSRRAMGDIDFIVKQDDFDRTKKILVDNNYIIHSESEQYLRHIGLKKNGIEFELHRFFSEDETVDIDEYVFTGIDNPVEGLIEEHTFPMLPRLANGLVLLLHMRQHLKSALGLRQVIDWMMYVYNNLDDDFWNSEFSTVAQEKGLDTLAIVATRMCQIYLGLPETITWCKNADERICEQLIETLLVSGNFGRKQGKGSSVETVSTSIKRKGLFRWLQYAGEYNWKAYQKHHWLKPFCWLYQIFRYAKQGLKSGRNRKQISDDFERSEKRFELLKKLGIEQ